VGPQYYSRPTGLAHLVNTPLNRLLKTARSLISCSWLAGTGIRRARRRTSRSSEPWSRRVRPPAASRAPRSGDPGVAAPSASCCVRWSSALPCSRMRKRRHEEVGCRVADEIICPIRSCLTCPTREPSCPSCPSCPRHGHIATQKAPKTRVGKKKIRTRGGFLSLPKTANTNCRARTFLSWSCLGLAIFPPLLFHSRKMLEASGTLMSMLT
jgi:hypothetical protein